MRSKVSVWLAVLSTVVGVSVGTRAQGSNAPSLAGFDEDVAVCRRVVRQYCAIVQDMAKDGELDATKQRKGLALLDEARGKWAGILKTYAANPPAEYASDGQFKARLQDFVNALEDMEKALVAGAPRRSAQACGFGCGLFVGMHEENGLDYAVDRLFHLRKDIKTTVALMKRKDMGDVRVRLSGLLQKRDGVLSAPPPFPETDGRASAYRAAVEELSRAMDSLAVALAAGNAKQCDEILANTLTLVNKAYGIAL